MQKLPTTLAVGSALGFNAVAATQLAFTASGLPMNIVAHPGSASYLSTVASLSGLVAVAAAFTHATFSVLFASALRCVHAADGEIRRRGERVALVGFALMAIEATYMALCGEGSTIAAPLAVLFLGSAAVLFDRLLEAEDDRDDDAAFAEAGVLGRGLAMHALMFPQLDEIMRQEDQRP